MTDVEEKRMKLQETEAKIITQENKYITSKNEVLNATMELNRIVLNMLKKMPRQVATNKRL